MKFTLSGSGSPGLPMNIRHFFMRSRADRQLWMKTFWMLWRVRLSLWFEPFDRLRQRQLKWVESLAAQKKGPFPYGRKEIIWAIASSARFVPGASCLTQALVGERLLNEVGLKPELCIGVARDEKGFKAHAWLELEGKPILGARGVEEYTRMR